MPTPANPEIRINKVASDIIDGIGYDGASQTLAIKFIPFFPKGLTTVQKEATPRPVYHYANVTQETWDAFNKAPSKGEFFHKSIKGKFQHRKVDAK